jgi:enamine deaminase RidA (YjgF/YER057c/UK114 family)
MERDRPGAATAELAGLFPDEAVVGVTGMAIARDESAGLVKSFPADTDAQATGRKFSDVVAAGPYVFTTYFPTDNKTGVHPDVLAPIWHWRGSEARNEAAFGVQTLTTRLESVGAALSDVVDYTLFLSEVGDLYEVDLVFSEALGELAPSRTIIPTRGFAVPRREGAVGHVEGATRMEAQFRCIRPGYSVEKVAVPGPSSGFGYQSAGVRVGTLLWLSSQYSGAEHYGNTAQELDDIFEKLEVTCRNAGTGLRELLRVRALVTRPDDAFKVFGALHKVFPADPPVVSIIVAPTLQVEGATVAVDGVAYVEDS